MFLPIHAIFKKCYIAKNKVVFTREYLAGKLVKVREIDAVNFVFRPMMMCDNHYFKSTNFREHNLSDFLEFWMCSQKLLTLKFEINEIGRVSAREGLCQTLCNPFFYPEKIIDSKIHFFSAIIYFEIYNARFKSLKY